MEKESLLVPLMHAASTQDMSQLVALLHENDSKGDFSSWMDPLISHLLSSAVDEDEEKQEQPQHALWLVGALAKSQPDVYLLPIAKAVAHRIDLIAARTMPGSSSTAAMSSSTTTTADDDVTTFCISPPLLQVWIQQLTQTSQVVVHTFLLEALLQAIQMKGPSLGHPSLELLTDIWNHHWQIQGSDTTTTNRQSSSVVAVRCATVFISFIDTLGEWAMVHGQQVGATRLFSQMLHSSSSPSRQDPLMQLSILDLLSPDHFPTSCAAVAHRHHHHRWPTSVKAWLTSPEILLPIQDMLDDNDPLLAGSALQCASWLVAVAYSNSATNDSIGANEDDMDEDQPTLAARLLEHIFHYIREDLGTTSNETDRLSIVQALVQLSTIPPPLSISTNAKSILEGHILVDAQLRCAWWDMTRISSPKLQAAILASVAQVLQSFREDISPVGSGVNGPPSSLPFADEASNCRIRIRMYHCLGMDNGIGGESKMMNHNTTDWLHRKCIQSPMPELRIATYAIWEAVASLSSSNAGGGGITTLSASQHFWSHMLEESGGREMTSDARIAKYHVLEALHRTSQHTNYLSKNLQTRLEQLLQWGPHGMKAQAYDVALE